jgi:energy-coupling factor transport system permease protein
MNPKAAAVWSAAAITVALSSNNPVYRVLVLLAALNFLAYRHRTGTSVKPLFIAVPVVALLATAYNILASHYGQHVFAHIPSEIPIIGGALTFESMAYGAGIGLGVAAAVTSAAALSLIIEPLDLVDALPRWLHRTGAAVATSLSMVPGTARSFAAVREAQLLRGVRLRGVTAFRNVLVPVTLTTLESSIQLAAAMDARGFGSGPRTRAYAMRWSANDIAVVALSTVSAAAFISLRLRHAIADWTPLAAPHATVAAVLACLLLLAPAITRSSHASQ